MKPMLAVAITRSQLKDIDLSQYMVSQKIDGIRCIVIVTADDVQILSRSLKPIRNKHIVETLTQHFKGKVGVFDGELVAADSLGNILPFNETSSTVMNAATISIFKYLLFDIINDQPYCDRYSQLVHYVGGAVELVTHSHVDTVDAFIEQEARLGNEGIILRKTTGAYKYGRSTLKEGGLIKYKFFTDNEFVVKGYTEKMHNTNEQTVNETGHSVRSSSAEGLIPTGTLGALILECDGVEFGVGTGFTEAMRKELWDMKDELIGKLAKVKYISCGGLNVPRPPVVFLGFRDMEDLS